MPQRPASPAPQPPQHPLVLPTGRRPVIAVDMDEVIADALAEHLLRYNRDFGTIHTPADLYGRNLWDLIPPDHHHALAGYMLSADFFAVLDVMPHAQRVLARLQTRFDIFIATAAMEVPTSFTAKFDWLARHFPFIPPSHIVFCGDKSILRADFLIDDNPRQLQRFEARAAASSAPPHAVLSTGAPLNSVISTGAPLNTVLSTGAPLNSVIATGAPLNTVLSTGAPPNAVLSTGAQRSGETPVSAPAPSAGQPPAFHPQGILYTAPANIHVLGYRRVANWAEIETLFLG